MGTNCEIKTPCACDNGGIASGTFFVDNDCACDCTGTDYEGDTCTQCITTNEENTNCVALTDDNIFTARGSWISDQTSCIATYGHISNW